VGGVELFESADGYQLAVAAGTEESDRCVEQPGDIKGVDVLWR
jgi:hypothetical protein